jgi:hypothetical protein
MKFERNVKSEDGETTYDLSIEVDDWEIAAIVTVVGVFLLLWFI